MASSIAIYHIGAHRRSTLIANAMAKGAKEVGDHCTLMRADLFREPTHEIACFYGFDAQMQKIFHAYRAYGLPVVYVDLGYFGRLEGGKWSGYHKVSVNGRHPTSYFQKKTHGPDRFSHFRLNFPRWRFGRHILVCGTSDKGALVDGFRPQEWENRTIQKLKKLTSRQIIYRPKPSWSCATPIPGSQFAMSKEDVSRWLVNCHAVVSHHSNVCVDAFLAGVPNFCEDGVGLPLSHSDLSLIEDARRDGNRQQWAQDVAYCQFSVKEMEEGVAWRVLKDEGLI